MTMWKRQQDWIGSEVDDQYVMIHLDSGRYMALNATATEAWHLLETPRRRDELVEAFLGRFRVARPDCERSVDAMLERMATLGLIESAEGDAGLDFRSELT